MRFRSAQQRFLDAHYIRAVRLGRAPPLLIMLISDNVYTLPFDMPSNGSSFLETLFDILGERECPGIWCSKYAGLARLLAAKWAMPSTAQREIYRATGIQAAEATLKWLQWWRGRECGIDGDIRRAFCEFDFHRHFMVAAYRSHQSMLEYIPDSGREYFPFSTSWFL